MTFRFPVVPRYAEVDQQGVVFFGHYLTWFDEAFSGFLAHRGVPYPELIASGLDVQVVHAEVDYRESVRWGDDVGIAVTLEKVGTSSLTSSYAVHRTPDAAEPAVVGRLVHVCVGTDDWTKRPVPETLRSGGVTTQSTSPATRRANASRSSSPPSATARASSSSSTSV